MMMMFLLVLCIFVTVWMGIIFIGAALNKSLGRDFPAMNILLLSLSLTGIITNIMGLW